MKKLSLCLIVKNEEKNLGFCLNNAKEYADEIVIVDTGSVDRTKEIAGKYTDKVYDFTWVYDFSKARNFAFDKATKEYLMWLDADDIVPKESVKNILKWKNDETDFDVLLCPYVTAFDENFNPIFQFNRERIVKNEKRFRFKERVHEVIVPAGTIKIDESIKIYHNKKEALPSTRNLDIYEKMIAEGETLSPRSQFYYARELSFHKKYDEAIHMFSKFLYEGKGWVENKIEACLNLSKCYQAKGEEDKALSVLFGSFVYDLPRGETLYEIGNVFLSRQDYIKAIYYFKLALEAKPNLNSGGFVTIDCYGFLPAIQLCVCYHKLGDMINSRHYHEVSKAFKPDSELVKYNEKYFEAVN